MLINLTPHSVTIRKPDDTVITIPPSGSIARVESFEEPRPDTEGIPTIRRMWGGINLGTTIEEGNIYIVSTLVLDAVQDETDPLAKVLVAPDTGQTAVRDDRGQIVEVKRFITL